MLRQTAKHDREIGKVVMIWQQVAERFGRSNQAVQDRAKLNWSIAWAVAIMWVAFLAWKWTTEGVMQALHVIVCIVGGLACMWYYYAIGRHRTCAVRYTVIFGILVLASVLGSTITIFC